MFEGARRPGASEQTSGNVPETRRQSWTPAPDVALDLNGPQTPFVALPEDLPSRSLFAAFAAAVEQDPEGIAVQDGTNVLTRARVMELALHLARALRMATPESGRVAILQPSGAWYPVAMLGCLAAGRIYAALDPIYPEDRNTAILAEFAPDCVVSRGRDAAGLCPDALYLDMEALPAQGQAEGSDTPVDGDAPAIVLYTSGSTGKPKGIVNAQRAVLQRVVQQVNASHIGPGDVVLCLTSPCTIAGTREIFSALLSGATLWMADPERQGIGNTRRLIREQSVTLLYAVPSLMRVLIGSDEPRVDFASLRVVRLGGEKVTWSDVDLLHRTLSEAAFVQVGYSSTETTGSQRFASRDPSRRGAAPSIGYMLPGVDYAIVDEDGCPVDPGLDGELVIRSPFVALGAWRDGACRPDNGQTDAAGCRILRTGDIVRSSANGLLEALGRKDRQIKINGRRVEPAEIEAAMRAASDVDDAIVLPVSDGSSISIIGFLAVGEADAAGAEEAVRGQLRMAVPLAWHPARFHTMPSLPRLPSGKVDTVTLAALDRAQQTRAGAALEISAMSADGIVSAAWMRVLRRRKLPAAITWDQAGGDSLSLLRLVFEFEKAVGHELALESFDVTMSVAAMEAVIAAIRRGNDTPGDARPLVFLCPGLTGDSPSLAAFRADLAKHFLFVVLKYPSWQDMLAAAMTIEAIADSVMDQILAKSPTGPIRLAGYSLGGAVGYEVALRLISRSRQIEWFAAIDANVAPGRLTHHAMPVWRTIRSVSGLLRRKQSFAQRACQLFALWAASSRDRHILQRLARSKARLRLPESAIFALNMEICEALQMQALKKWITAHKAIRLSTKIYVFRSKESRHGVGRDLGWSRHFEEVVVRNVEGNHVTMLRLPYRAELCAQFIKTIPPAEHYPKLAYSSRQGH
ncbi:AMP-binding protein [Beijerinckia sp. L45]|uniref:AMP-binding protein n=1 Tax=Beijerinckia sp. L45 TaxID=1641855 RepID=UPI00131B2323|nr:AMP-binding protein [Beijerinckia sp. L45]